MCAEHTFAMSEQSCELRTFKHGMGGLEPKNGQVGVSTNSSCELFDVGKDFQTCIKPAKPQQALRNNYNGSIATHEPTIFAPANSNATNCCMHKVTTSNPDIVEKLDPFAYCRWSTSDEVTTSSDIDFSVSTLNSKSHTSDLSSSNFQDLHHAPRLGDFKGHFNPLPPLII